MTTVDPSAPGTPTVVRAATSRPAPARRWLPMALLMSLAAGGCGAQSQEALAAVWHPAPSAPAVAVSAPPPPTRAAPSPTPEPSAVATGAEQLLDGPYGTQRTTGTQALSLTFDDGPSQYTDRVLDALARAGVTATFCVIGSQVRAHAAQLRRIVAEGHTLCNHTWRHDLELRTRGTEAIMADLVRTNDAIRTVVPHADIGYFRNPGGNFDERTVAAARKLGMVPLFWSVDSRDWETQDAEAIAARVTGGAHPGAIVLLHDGGGDRGETLRSLETILPFLTGRYRVVPLT